MKRLNGVDALMLYTETPEIHMHTLKIGVLDVSNVEGGFSFDLFRAVAFPRLQAMAPLRYQLVDIPLKLHHPMWVVNDDIDFDYHVRQARVPAPGGRRELGSVDRRDRQHPAGPQPPAVGDVRRRGPRRQPHRDHPQGPPRAGRRCGVGQPDGEGDGVPAADRGRGDARGARYGADPDRPAEGRGT